MVEKTGRPIQHALLIAILLTALVIGLAPIPTSQPHAAAQSAESNAVLVPSAPQDDSYVYLPLILRNWRYLTAEQRRFGVTQRYNWIDLYDATQLNAGWYLTDSITRTPPRPFGMEVSFVIRVRPDLYDPVLTPQRLAPVVDSNPGMLWQIGNEPDRPVYQDGRTPGDYAVIYHDLYAFLKGRDPTCQVAIGGVIQPTPLRLQWLDLVRSEYQSRYGTPMPVDVWNIHNAILQELKGSWGAEIPLGLPGNPTVGMLYTIQDNDNLTIFRNHIYTFRQWMADRGQRNKPLIVTEFGILMPELYGFDHARVKAFMYATFDFFRTATSATTGYPADGNRLVQRWSWYSLDDRPYNPSTGLGFNGNLFNPDTFQITQFGLDYAAYTQALR